MSTTAAGTGDYRYWTADTSTGGTPTWYYAPSKYSYVKPAPKRTRCHKRQRRPTNLRRGPQCPVRSLRPETLSPQAHFPRRPHLPTQEDVSFVDYDRFRVRLQVAPRPAEVELSTERSSGARAERREVVGRVLGVEVLRSNA